MRIRNLFLSLFYVLTLPAQPAQSVASDGGTPVRKIILFDPVIRIEDVRGIVPKIPDAASEDYKRVLVDAVQRLPGGAASFLNPDSLGEPAARLCGELIPQISRLARGEVTAEAMQTFKDLAVRDDRFAVLVQFLRLRTGPGASWNAISGGVTSSAASTLEQAALVSVASGAVIWKGEQLVRNKALKAGDPELAKTLSQLFRNFPMK